MYLADATGASIVFDPSLSMAGRRRLRRKIRRGDSGSGFVGGLFAFGLFGTIVLPFLIVRLHHQHYVTWWWMFTILIPAPLGFGTGVALLFRLVTDDDKKRFVEGRTLDEDSRRLLVRAQRASIAVRRSRVYASDRLEHVVGEKLLRRHEWEIATSLRKITDLRAEVEKSTKSSTIESEGREPGPMTAAVLNSHRRALKIASDATNARVVALEHFAEQLTKADAAKQDWEEAIKASGRNDRYLDLVARTAADRHAIAELTELTEQAAAAAHAFDDSIHEADLAAEALALPDDDAKG